MKTPDKQWSQQKDKDRNKAERDKLRKQSEQQQAQDQGGPQQGEPDRQATSGRKPPLDATATTILTATVSDADLRGKPDFASSRPVGLARRARPPAGRACDRSATASPQFIKA